MAKTEIRYINLSKAEEPCPKCGTISKRHSVGKRKLHEINKSKPLILEVTLSKHYCLLCRKHFSLSLGSLAPSKSRYTTQVRRIAVDYVAQAHMTLEDASFEMQKKHNVRVPPTTLYEWVIKELPSIKVYQ